jgi:hypothetical protein
LSKASDIQQKYKGYVAAYEAIQGTLPKDVEVVYKSGGQYTRYDGLIVYEPQKDRVKINPERGNNNYIFVPAEDIPALMNALREMFE